MNAYDYLFGERTDLSTFQKLLDTVKDLQRQLDELRNLFPNNLPADNSSLTASLQLSQPETTRRSRIYLAEVIYAVPSANFYRLSLPVGNTEIGGIALTEAGGTFGIADAKVYTPGTQVAVLRFGNEDIGYILAAVPASLDNAAFNHADRVVTGSNVGIDREFSLYTVLQNDDSIPAHGDDQPLDLAGGEFGKFSKTGGGIFLDMFMAYMRVSELAGIWFHFFDNYTRLNGHNLDIRTALGEDSVRAVHSELQSIRGEALFLHERLGSLSLGQGYEAQEPLSVRFEKPVGAQEPTSDTPAAYYRLRDYGGYLGQMRVTEIVAPLQSSGQHSYDSPAASRTLYRSQLCLDGSYSQVSATGGSSIKQGVIPQIEAIKLAEDSDSDKPGDYKFAGLSGEGADHNFDFNYPQKEPGSSQGDLIDRVAYETMWRQVRQFRKHGKQFRVQQNLSGPRYRFSELRTKQSLTPPEPFAELPLTPGGSPKKLYNTVAGDVTETDGTRHIFGPAGQCITLGTDGHIRMSAPGDIIMQCRRAITEAYEDVILKAQDSVDITASQKDVRLKAHSNFEIAAGVSGRGRFLIDHRGIGEPDFLGRQGEDISGGGFIIKTRSQLCTYSAGAYLRSGGTDIVEGDFVIDVGRGKRLFELVAASALVRTDSGVSFAFPARDAVDDMYFFSRQYCSIPADTYLDGSLYVADGNRSIFGNDILILNGHIATQRADALNYLVSPLNNDRNNSLKNTQESLKSAKDSRDDANEQYEELVTGIEDRLYQEPTQAGTDDFIFNTGFSYRDEKQYGTETEYVLPASLWQTIGEDTGRTWLEQPIVHQNIEGSPYPGYKNWFERATFVKKQPQLYSAASSRYADLEAFENFSGTPSVSVTPATGYVII